MCLLGVVELPVENGFIPKFDGTAVTIKRVFINPRLVVDLGMLYVLIYII